jgi:uncharacterized protein (DUF488 family)
VRVLGTTVGRGIHPLEELVETLREARQAALAEALAEPAPCFMCSETPWWRCHRRLIAELLVARGHTVVHLLGPRRREPHRLYDETEVRDGRLLICGSVVA